MLKKIVAVLLILMAAGCASRNSVEQAYHPYEKFDEYKPYEEKVVCPLCFVEFIPEIPGIVYGD